MTTPYCGSPPVPAEWLSRWNLDPLLLLVMGCAVGAWLRWIPRDPLRDRAAGAALGVALIIFVSPLCALSSALFSARVTHHVLLVAVFAPLLAFAVAPRWRFRLGIAPATALHAATFWAWHLPAAYAAALGHDALYWALQVSIGGAAVLFWLAVLRAHPIAAAGGLLTTMVQMGALGALLTFAGRALYAPHWSTTEPWGLAPLDDQQLGGLIMSAPAAALYLLAAMVILFRAFQPAPAR